jgi:hypothetical protein
VALVNNSGKIVEVINTRDWDALESGAQRSQNMSTVSVPKTVAAGKYRLSVVVKPSGEKEWKIATMSIDGVSTGIDFTVRNSATTQPVQTTPAVDKTAVPKSNNDNNKNKQVGNFPLAIRMAEERIKRYVTTPENVLENERGRNVGWDKVELISTKELKNGSIELTLHYSAGQGTKMQTNNWTTSVKGPKNTNVYTLGVKNGGGGEEKLSAYDAQNLIEQCKERYANDADYRKIVDIIEREVIAKLKYDWDSYLNKKSRSYEEAIKLGLGVCDDYARLTKDVLTKAGYKVEKWSSSFHSWNHIILPNGKTLYVDATWYSNEYENHPTDPSPDLYMPFFITYDKNLFERGLKGTIRLHGAWPNAKRDEDKKPEEKLILKTRDR